MKRNIIKYKGTDKIFFEIPFFKKKKKKKDKKEEQNKNN